MKRSIKFIVIGVVIILLGVLGYFLVFNNKESDSEKFSKEYGIEENVFVYRDINEIIKILENGTGIVYLGFPECPWCKAYVKILNEVAKEEGVEKIYYYNILEDRSNNTKEYQKIVSILDENLLYDEEGNRRIYVPDVSFVLNGDIIGHDNETSVITEDITPEDYWTNEKIETLKTKLRTLVNEVSGKMCTDCNKE